MSDQMAHLEKEESSEMATTAAKMFDVNPSSIRTRQLCKRHQERNSCGIFNSYGGNKLILTNAQEQAVSRFCLEQLEISLGATPSILYAAICHLCQQEKKNPPSLRWFQLWIKKNPHLHSIKTKPIAQARITTHSEEDVKDFFVEYQNTLSKYGIKREPPPSFIICPGEKIMENWIQDNLTGAEVITVSPTGYTSERIALAWLDHFIKHAGAGPDQHWCTLLHDGHITHCQNDFVIKCHEKHIIRFQFPSHLTHVLQPLDVGVFHPWKHNHNKAIHDALHSLDMEYSISSFFRDLSTIRMQTFQAYTIKNSFRESGMFPVSYKMALKTMRHYNKRKPVGAQSGIAMTSESTSNTLGGPSVKEGGDLELPTLPSTYFECQKGIGEWIDHAESFSPTSNTWFQ
ncbi:hypothetical protein L873DRAFT_1940985 [Choiromyces venosus 120613-1]|uniref:DDE-1 domain-containing protein n=1 Tax=Choiromyces venosus 120613-1 TaxID=1336337 RepID=A0A3N4J764_9PEZI|nr:hypothetical protein L873DRAFT_1940985 [Choiromyces venosus 120613-1]